MIIFEIIIYIIFYNIYIMRLLKSLDDAMEQKTQLIKNLISNDVKGVPERFTDLSSWKIKDALTGFWAGLILGRN